MEAFVGYDFVRFNPNSVYAPSFNANGGSGQFVYNVTRWLGGVLDVGAVNKGTLNQLSVDTTVMNFVAGPRVTFHNHSRFLPFAQVLFGGAYATTSTPVTVLPGEATIFPPGVVVSPNLPVQARLTASHVGFAMLAGGGLDIRISRHVAFRPVEANYYLTRIPSIVTGNVSNRNNFRYSAGVNFLFGEAK
jgi:hypothetical protein